MADEAESAPAPVEEVEMSVLDALKEVGLVCCSLLSSCVCLPRIDASQLFFFL